MAVLFLVSAYGAMPAKNIDQGLKILWLLALGLASGWTLLRASASQHAVHQLPSPFSQQPPASITRVSVLGALAGQRALAADWAYVECLQYLGDAKNFRDANFQKVGQLYEELLWLDPSFRFAVMEGATVLGWFTGRRAQSKALLEKAMRIDPGFVRYRLYYAALAYLEKDDPNAMLDQLREEVKRADASEMLLRMVGNIYIKHEDWQGALTYWRWVQSRAREQQTLDAAQRTIQKVLKQLQSKGN